MRIGIDCRKIADFGIGTYVRELLRAMAAAAPDATFVAFGPRSIESHLPPAGSIERVDADAPHYSIRELATIGRAANAAGLDLFHAPHYVIPLVRGPVVVTIHDLIHLQVRHANPLRLLYARGMLRRATRRPARIITVTEAVARTISRAYPDATSKIRAVHNGVEDRFFEARPPSPSARRYFLWIGNDKPHKNLSGLIAAWRKVAPSLPDCDLVLAGAPPEALRAEPQVRIAGFVPAAELPSLLAGAVALVLPSFLEGFGLPVAEAMAAGCPVIASAIPPLREVAGDAAVWCDPADPESIAAAMTSLAGDPALRGELIGKGRQRSDRFRWQRSAEKTIEIYREAMLEKMT
ncbi:MAG: glycosyltransferase family 4 protein [Thermoanaerobaculia bacterium]